MAKKKGKKKDPDTKKKNKKKESKKKDLKKKKLKKKDKKKDRKKRKPEKKKNSKKNLRRQDPFAFPAEPKVEKPKRPAPAPASDKSSNYIVRDALKKLKSLKSAEKIMEFTQGEKRKTIAKAVAPALRKFRG